MRAGRDHTARAQRAQHPSGRGQAAAAVVSGSSAMQSLSWPPLLLHPIPGPHQGDIPRVSGGVKLRTGAGKKRGLG